MEILEMEKATEIEESEINFDFLNEEIEPQALEKAENSDWIFQETLVVIVKAKNEIGADFDICGKKMADWVSLSTSGCKQKFIEEPEDILAAVKPLCEDYFYVAVFYSDTPLLKKTTFVEIMQYFSTNQMNALKLARGYVFKSDYLQTTKMLMSSAIVDFDKEDFFVVDNAEKVSIAFEVLNDRILNYHKQNGVVLFGEDTIFVDADVEIEAGTIIYPNNVIKGESYIGKNAIIESGNYILDTIVCDDVFVCQSYLENSKVEQGKSVGPFERLINKKV